MVSLSDKLGVNSSGIPESLGPVQVGYGTKKPFLKGKRFLGLQLRFIVGSKGMIHSDCNS